ncbi:MAG TPA: UbiA family prenyltransferase [Puia sp.]|uniref:UbiA family prenyltransferase n=1 Tax=Puia sp. TaxID=2045100 RepID=UPI002CE732A4|nr:UbiA family prenyltransferase [Puia sp.]HVU99237.1 UbiA family prenyltransferase [Puia sp.]
MKKAPSSTLQLLRLPFSFFLMPVYWFALSQVVEGRDWARALLIFFILHGLVYPASNGYNSYMDRDTTPIGGLENPLPPTRELFWVTLAMDAVALVLGFLIGFPFAAGLAVYILASRAYSYRGIRLKRYPLTGWLTVISCQGALIFWIVYQGSHRSGAPADVSSVAPAMLAASLLLGGFYPLTQIYQHEADRQDGVRTLSMVLGYRGSFVFTGLIYGVAFGVLAYYFLSTLQVKEFYVLATCMLPVIVYFWIWAIRVWRDPAAANFANTMRMNLLASICTNAGFIAVLVMS